MPGCVAVAVDRKYDRNCDIGAFELAFKQPVVTVPPYIGISLSVDGQALRKPAGFGLRRTMESSHPTDVLFTPRPVLRQINAEKFGEGLQKKNSSGPGAVSSASTHIASGNCKETDTPDNGSVTSCPPKAGGMVSETSSTVVQIDGKTGGATRNARAHTSESSSGHKTEKGESNKTVTELKVPSTQMFPPSRVVYNQHTPLIGDAGNKRIVSKTSVSTNYTIPHAPSSNNSSASRPLVVNNVESTDLKTFKATKGNHDYKLVSFPPAQKVKKTIKVMGPGGGQGAPPEGGKHSKKNKRLKGNYTIRFPRVPYASINVSLPPGTSDVPVPISPPKLRYFNKTSSQENLVGLTYVSASGDFA